MAINLGELLYTLSIDSKGMIKALDDAQIKAEDFDKAISKLSASTKAVGEKLTKNLTLPILALGAASVAFATSAEVSFKKFAKAFQGAEEAAGLALTELNKTYGLSEAQATRLLANTGDLLKGFGATADQALATSLAVQKLSVALSAYNGVPVAEASQKITKALLGETDGLVELGIKLSQTDVTQELVRLGKDKLTGSSLLLAKSEITLALAAKQSGDAIAGFADNSSNLAFQSQALLGDLQDLAVSFGEALLPFIKEVVDIVRPLVQGFTDLDTSTKTMIITIAAIVAAIGPALIGISSITSAIQFLNSSAILGPLGIIVAIGATVAALVLLAQAGKKAGDEWKIYQDILKGGTTKDPLKDLALLEKGVKELEAAMASILPAYGRGYDDIVKQRIDGLVNEINLLNARRLAIQKNIEMDLKLSARDKEQADLAAKNAAAVAAGASNVAKYEAARKNVLSILQDEWTEQQKILAQIAELESTPWAKGKAEDDRLAAIKILRAKIVELDIEEKKAAKERQDAATALARLNREIYVEEIANSQGSYATIRYELETAALKASASEREILNQRITDNEEARQKELLTRGITGAEELKQIDLAYLESYATISGDRLTLLEVAYQKEIDLAKSKGISIEAIDIAYAEKRKNLLLTINDEETAKEKAKVDSLAAINEGWVDKLDNLNKTKLELLYKERDEAIAAALKTGADIDKIKAYYAQKELDLNASTEAEKKKQLENYISTFSGYAQDVISNLGSLWDAQDAARVNAIDRDLKLTLANYDAQIAGLSELSNSQLEALYTERDEKIAAAELAGEDIYAIQDEYAQREIALKETQAQAAKDLENAKLKAIYDADVIKYQLELDAFKRNQVISFAEIAIQTAVAIMKAYDLGPIAGSIAAAIIAGIGALQSAVVFAQPLPTPPTAPAYLADGGYAPYKVGGYNAVIGEANDELVLPLTDAVFQKLGEAISGRLSESKQALALTVIIEGLGQATLNLTQDALNDGIIRVPSRVIVN